MPSDAGDPKELGAFLRARRAELDPQRVGLPDYGDHRRVAGLRREEVAQLVSISSDYYTRIEQGRMRASVQVLESLATALRLTGDQRTYLFGLAGRPLLPSPGATGGALSPSTRRLLDQLTDSPALVLSDAMDVLGWNPLASALLTDFDEVPEDDRNYVWLLFNDPGMRELYEDWPSGARACLAYMRMHSARHPENPRLLRLLDRMASDADFVRWWGEGEVALQDGGSKVFRHPVAGDLVLDWGTLETPTAPDQHVVIWTAEPGSPSAKALRGLVPAQRVGS